MKIIERNIDPEGRILLPREWRSEHGRKITLIQIENYIRIIPMKKRKLSDLFDKVKVDLKAKLTDWDAVEKELFGRITI